MGESGYIRLVIQYFYKQLIKNELINLRKLLKFTRGQSMTFNKQEYIGDRGWLKEEGTIENFLDITISFLISVLDGKENLLKYIKIILKNNLRLKKTPYLNYI